MTHGKRFAIALLTTAAMAAPALAHDLMDEATSYCQLLPSTIPAQVDKPITAERIGLGRMLSFDPRLSASGVFSSYRCHTPPHWR